MANRFWKGGGSSTNWNATAPTNWAATSGGANNQSVPGSSDAVIFDGNSGSGNSVISASNTVQSITCTGYAGTLTHNSGVIQTINSAGGLVLVAGMTYTPVDSTARFTFTGAITPTFTTAGKTIGSVTVASGANVTPTGAVTALGQLLRSGNSNVYSDGGFAQQWDNVSWGGTGSSITLSAGVTWTLTGTGTVWSAPVSAAVTASATSRILITDSSATSKAFSPVGQTYGILEFSKGAGTSTDSITNTATFATLKNSGTAPFTLTLLNGGSTTISSASGLQLNGTPGRLVSLTSDSAGVSASLVIASGNATLYNISLKDIAASGGATFYARQSTNVSGNSGWIFTDNRPFANLRR